MQVLKRMGAVARRAATALTDDSVQLVNASAPAGEIVLGPETWAADTYESLYEAHANALPPSLSIGAGDYDTMGRIMLSVLLQEGLESTHTFVDFGCGTGRLARHVIPRLAGGAYIGIDISVSMLEQAKRQIEQSVGTGTDVRWIHQTGTSFDLPDGSVDYLAAFSVFTHMEHEDTYLYLRDAHRVARNGGRFLLSCLTMCALGQSICVLQRG